MIKQTWCLHIHQLFFIARRLVREEATVQIYYYCHYYYSLLQKEEIHSLSIWVTNNMNHLFYTNSMYWRILFWLLLHFNQNIYTDNRRTCSVKQSKNNYSVFSYKIRWSKKKCSIWPHYKIIVKPQYALNLRYPLVMWLSGTKMCMLFTAIPFKIASNSGQDLFRLRKWSNEFFSKDLLCFQNVDLNSCFDKNPQTKASKISLQSVCRFIL